MPKKSKEQIIEELIAEINQLETEMPAIQQEAKRKSAELVNQMFDDLLEKAEVISQQNSQ